MVLYISGGFIHIHRYFCIYQTWCICVYGIRFRILVKSNSRSQTIPFVSLRLQKDIKEPSYLHITTQSVFLFVWFLAPERKECTWGSQLFLVTVLLDVWWAWLSALSVQPNMASLATKSAYLQGDKYALYWLHLRLEFKSCCQRVHNGPVCK